MVGNNADGNVCLGSRFALLIADARDLADIFADRAQRINIEHRVDVLHRNGQTLEAHTGIDVFLRKLGVIALAITVELGKNVIPDLHETVAVASRSTVRFTAAVLLAAVIIDLRARAAGAFAMLPEIILSAGTPISSFQIL